MDTFSCISHDIKYSEINNSLTIFLVNNGRKVEHWSFEIRLIEMCKLFVAPNIETA